MPTICRYWQEIERPADSVLCYNTARCITEYKKLLQATPHLPPPDVVITGDGTDVWWTSSQGPGNHEAGLECSLKVDTGWRQGIRSQWRDSGAQ